MTNVNSTNSSKSEINTVAPDALKIYTGSLVTSTARKFNTQVNEA